MVNESITKEDLTKLEENLGGMIAKGFDENTEQHQKIDERFEKIDERFGNVNARLDIIEGDVKEIKDGMIFLEKYEDLESRVRLLEEKAGIIS